jgi:hypothetical protein
MNRKIARRKLDECRKHTAWIEYHLALLEDVYRAGGKDDWANYFKVARELNIELDRLLLQYYENL